MKGFGEQKKPRVWLEVVGLDGSTGFIRCNKQHAGTHALATHWAAKPEVDFVLVINGQADLGNVQESDIWADYGRFQEGEVA